jgi:hypothetical protein
MLVQHILCSYHHLLLLLLCSFRPILLLLLLLVLGLGWYFTFSTRSIQ